MNLLPSLSREGVHFVKVSKVHKKNVLVMYILGNLFIKCLEEVIDGKAPKDTLLKWGMCYLMPIKQTK